jgi:hypothetical protein
MILVGFLTSGITAFYFGMKKLETLMNQMESKLEVKNKK